MILWFCVLSPSASSKFISSILKFVQELNFFLLKCQYDCFFCQKSQFVALSIQQTHFYDEKLGFIVSGLGVWSDEQVISTELSALNLETKKGLLDH